MLRQFLTILSASVFLLASTAPVMAEPDLFPATRSHTHDQYSRSTGVTAGAYMRVPFNGGLKRPSAEPRFGLRLTGNFAGQSRYQDRFAGNAAHRLLDLSIGTSGTGSLRFNGMTIDQFNALYADDEDNEKGMHPVIIGLAVVGGVILILSVVFVIRCSSNNNDEGFSIC